MNIIVDEWSNYEARLVAKAASRERLRIWRAQTKALSALEKLATGWAFPAWAWPTVLKGLAELRAATCAPRKDKQP